MYRSRNRYSGFSPSSLRRLRYQARKLMRHPALPFDTQEDWEQTLMLRLLEDLGQHDPNQAALDTFINCILTSKVRMILRHARRLKRGEGLVRLMELSDDTELLVSLCAEEAALSSSLPWDEAIALQQDVAKVISRLPEPLRSLCQALKEDPSKALAAKRYSSRYVLYRHLRKLRDIFIESGLDHYF